MPAFQEEPALAGLSLAAQATAVATPSCGSTLRALCKAKAALTDAHTRFGRTDI